MASPTTRPALAPLLRELRAGLDALYGARLDRLVLFGSEARGEATAASDVDVLVVLHGGVDGAAEIERMSALRFRYLTEYGRLVSLVPVSSWAFAHRAFPLLVHARAEGVPLS